MRYLYGDSFPFQLQYNFLSTLETFIGAGAKAVQLEREIAQLRGKHAVARAERQKSLGELEAFHATVAEAVHACAARATTPATTEFARSVEEHAGRLLEDARRAATQADEREESLERAEADARRDDVKAAVESFLLSGRLPTLEAKITLELVDGHNVLGAVFYNPQHIVTRFTLAAHQIPAWRRERKVSDFTRGIAVQVGVKKSLFKRTMQPEVVQLDDYLIGGLDLSNDAAEIRLRKRTDAKDSLVFHIRRESGEIVADVTREGDDGPTSVDLSDRPQLEQLWQLVRTGLAEVLPHKDRLVAVEIDDQNVFTNHAVTAFFERIVKLFAPIVAEIARRSPNPTELSLKHEDDSGRREEIYVRKKDLLDKLEPLDEGGRVLFAPLWAPREESSIDRDEMPSLDITLDTMDEL